eukprot:TRINITY_DN7449_c0_g1_i1.p3 TRINITY_DN7449_c0_g1~~TRINITY_DN7449_c0_g1_i1.p3  ORF type:complete len:199 (+),score=39.89 TRINITY_DN7449_c0_g1_i1:64-660(+)
MVHTLLRSHQRYSNLLSTSQFVAGPFVKSQTQQSNTTIKDTDLTEKLLTQNQTNQVPHHSNQQFLTNIGNSISPRCVENQSLRLSSIKLNEEVQLEGGSWNEDSPLISFLDDDSSRSKPIASDFFVESYGLGESLRAQGTPDGHESGDDGDQEDQEDLEKALEEFAEIGEEDDDEGDDEEEEDYEDEDALDEYSKTEK